MSLNCVKHKIRLPYRQIKGSIKTRKNMVEEWNEKVFHKVLSLYDNTGLLPIRGLDRTYKSLLPNKLPINVKKNLKPNAPIARLSIYYNKYLIPQHANISIPAENNSLRIEDFPEFMHESTHVFDLLFQPKILSAERELLTKDFADGVINLYHTYFYTNSKNMIQTVYNLIKNLKNKTNRDKIIVLKYLKNNMLTELHAYQEGEKYGYLLNKKEDMAYKNYHFERKIKIINFMLGNIIKKERNV